MTEHDSAIVLVVEDEAELADMYAEWLTVDYDVRVAYDGETALEDVDADVDVVLLDRLMPGISGDEVLEEIGDRGYDPAVAMITAVEPDFDVIEMGFDDYLVKPVFADAVRSTVERLLVRATYDERLQHYFSLVSKRAALEEYRMTEEVRAHEEYAEIEAEIDALRTDLDGMLDEFDHDGFEAVFRSMERSSPAPDN